MLDLIFDANGTAKATAGRAVIALRRFGQGKRIITVGMGKTTFEKIDPRNQIKYALS